ncbi:MAG: hypothetical protein KC422_00885 [Trueperaceae bacterium]|nr:hypothetical protein [Trueperaceae bacterium]
MKKDKSKKKQGGIQIYFARNRFIKKVEPKRSLTPIKFYGKEIYRFFGEYWQAKALLEGKVWISTLSVCRNYENPLQGDPFEGKAEHTINAKGFGYERKIGLANEMTGMKNHEEALYSLNSHKIEYEIPDAYVLCTTEVYKPEKMAETFGNYAVKIKEPQQFFKVVTKKLEHLKGNMNSRFSRVIYKTPLTFQNEEIYTEPDLDDIGFLKMPDKYANQKEVRMLWFPSNRLPISPFLLNCSEASQFCELVTKTGF